MGEEVVIKLDLTLATTDFKKASDSVRREIYSILIEFSIPMKLASLIKMCSNKNLWFTISKKFL
jgi:hypothetical protein